MIMHTFACIIVYVHLIMPLLYVNLIPDKRCNAHFSGNAVYKISGATMAVDGENANFIKVDPFSVFNRPYYVNQYKNYFPMMPDFSKMHNTKSAGSASEENETQACALAFQGTMRVFTGTSMHEVSGSGHHGSDYVGVASVLSGKGMRMGSMNDSALMKIM
jgi:hypothetical protein